MQLVAFRAADTTPLPRCPTGLDGDGRIEHAGEPDVDGVDRRRRRDRIRRLQERHAAHDVARRRRTRTPRRSRRRRTRTPSTPSTRAGNRSNQSAPCHVTTPSLTSPGLQAAYAFDEATGTTATEASQHGVTGHVGERCDLGRGEVRGGCAVRRRYRRRQPQEPGGLAHHRQHDRERMDLLRRASLSMTRRSCRSAAAWASSSTRRSTPGRAPSGSS